MALPHSPFAAFAVAADVVAGLGCLQAAVGAVLVWRFGLTVRRVAREPVRVLPPVSILKPLHGDEPMLEQALESFCSQDYPDFQIVFGVQDPADAAIGLVRRLQVRFPDRALDLVIDATVHGANHKVGNLINMLPTARHALLVISDSDIHAEPGYLRRIAAALAVEGVGLVTTLYGGRPATGTIARRLAAAGLNHNFLPGVLMSRLLGRQDCLGATMALRRETLDAIGGLERLVSEIADDSALGHAVTDAGLSIAIADTLTMTTVSETGLRDMFGHELRWGRTVRSVEPLGYALSAIQLPLFWASLAVGLAPSAGWSWATLGIVWLWRIGTTRSIDRIVPGGGMVPAWLLPVRDWISAVVMIASFTGRRVAWRGHMLHLSSRAQPGSRGASVGNARTQSAARSVPETVD
jgi:ceramide glucosyltransferase